MSIRLALVGNPNSGKTTMFNALTGSKQYVGNWPGVTVEKKEGVYKEDSNVLIEDLPGIYSLSPYTNEEIITRDYLINERPDVVINIVDASNLERNLYLTTQILEIGIPVVVVLNMMDVVEKSGDKIDTNRLSKLLGTKIIKTSALKNDGISECIKAAKEVLASEQRLTYSFSEDVEQTISEIQNEISTLVKKEDLRYISIKVLEQDKNALKHLEIPNDNKERILSKIKDIENNYDETGEKIIIAERYYVADSVVKNSLIKNLNYVSTTEKIDNILTHRYFALPIFALIMFFVYYISISLVGTPLSDYVNEEIFGALVPEFTENILNSLDVAPWLSSLILDGIIAGVGAVLGFLPQMAALFICLSILEDCGYMARVVFILDRVFRRFGLSGKSFIPLLVATGCTVPGIMASRTIESESDRKMTIITTSFIPCGAKLPVIALIAGAIFGGSPIVSASAYFLGLIAVAFSGIALKKTKAFASDPTPFVMELPPYHMPTLKNTGRTVWDRVVSFIKKAASVVFLATIAIWFLSNFNIRMQMVSENESLLYTMGKLFSPFFAPLGFGDYRAAVATFSGLIAKENIVAVFGIFFNNASQTGQWEELRGFLTPIAGYSFLAFNLLCAPCVAAMGAIKKEMQDAKWTAYAIIYECTLAYVVSFLIYQLGIFVTESVFTFSTVIAFVVLLTMLYFIFRKPKTFESKFIEAV